MDCDLTQESYLNIAQGVRYNHSLFSIDLTRNRVSSTRVAEGLSLMLQGASLRSLRMRHCDIKDRLGAIIFKSLRKNKLLEEFDMTNNLMGEDTARTICEELKYAKQVMVMRLHDNIIKYKDMQEIQRYLEGNKYHSRRKLYQEHKKINEAEKEAREAELAISQQQNRMQKLINENTSEFKRYQELNQQQKVHIVS